MLLLIQLVQIVASKEIDSVGCLAESVQEGGCPSQSLEAIMNESINRVTEIDELTSKIFGLNTAIEGRPM